MGDLHIMFNNNSMSYYINTKFLVLIMDLGCTLRPHIKYLIRGLSLCNYTLISLSSLVLVEASLCTYIAYVYSRFRYDVLRGC